MDKLIQLLKFLSASLNAQVRLRVNEHLRASLFGASIVAISFSLYRGWIDVNRATELYAIAVSVFGLTIHKSMPGEGTGLTVTQAPHAAKPEAGAGVTPLTPVAAVPIPEPTTPTPVVVPTLKPEPEPEPLDRIK